MAFAIPNPLPISCTDCRQPMRVEHQSESPAIDAYIVAAECGCGRVIGELSGMHLLRYMRGTRPIVRSDIQPPSEDIGMQARALIDRAREAITEAEKRIAAATWAKGKTR